MQAWIIPARDEIVRNKLLNLSLAKHSVCDVEATVLPNEGLVHISSLEQPVVALASDFELKGAQRVSDVFDRVAKAVSVVIRRVNAPEISRVRVGGILYTVSHEVAHVWIVVLHVDLASKRCLTFLVLTGAHLFEFLEVPFNRIIAGRRIEFVFAEVGHVFFILEAHISESLFDQPHGDLVKFLEVVRRGGSCNWLVAEPSDNLCDVIDVLLALLIWIGIIIAKIRVATILLCDFEIKTNSFGVSNVQVSVWLRRESGNNLATSSGSMFCENFRIIANINIAADKGRDIDSGLVVELFFLLGFFFVFGTHFVIFLACSITCRGFSKKLQLFLVDRS